MEELRGSFKQMSQAINPLNIQNFICLRNKDGAYVCTSQRCTIPGIMCINQNCECHQGHDQCHLIKIKQIIKIIQNKKQSPSDFIQNSFKRVEEWINNQIDKLSQIRQKYIKMCKYYSLSEQEIQFYELAQKYQFSKINGQLVYKIQSNQKFIIIPPNPVDIANIIQLKSGWANIIDLQMNFALLRKQNKQKFCKKEFSNGSYEGNVNFNKKQGFGIMKYKNGDTYQGFFKNDLKDGFGTYYFGKSEKYIGQWKNSTMNGQGTIWFQNGDKYQGYWRNQKREGKGKYTFKNGDWYQGGWNDNKKTGQGIMKIINDHTYEGLWKNDLKDGQGTQYYSNGSKFQGIWCQDEKNGEGIYIYSNGLYQKRTYQNDRLVIIDQFEISDSQDSEYQSQQSDYFI